MFCLVAQNIFIMALVRNANSLPSNFSSLAKTNNQGEWLIGDRIISSEDESAELYKETDIQNSLLESVSSQEIHDSNCSNPLEHVNWDDPALIGSFAALILINILVVAGNTLVIVAVFSSVKLRSVTNLFIVSLAVADMSLGFMVLPFSVTVAVFDTWLFGQVWCSVWLAVDVWMSTSSILNLVVISFDR